MRRGFQNTLGRVMGFMCLAALALAGVQQSHLRESRLVQFVEPGGKAARDPIVLDFTDLFTVVLSQIDPNVWLSLMHDSTFPKVVVERI